MDSRIDEIMAAMQQTLPHKRYVHTLGVAFLAASLAMAYGKNSEKAMIAGLLHDCAKCLPEEEILRQCLKKELPVSDTEKAHPYLLHGKLGAWYAKHKYGIKDEKILNAIRYHTTGRPDMCFLEKNIFLSDYIEIGRKQPTEPELDEIRRIAFQDIDQAVYLAARNTVGYLTKQKECGNVIESHIDNATIETMKFYERSYEDGRSFKINGKAGMQGFGE